MKTNKVKSSESEATSRTLFSYEYFDSQQYYDAVANEVYTRHNINIHNKITVKGVAFDAMYQTGTSFRNDDYTLPCNTLKLSHFDRTDDLIADMAHIKIEGLQTDEQIKNIISYLKNPLITNKEDVIALYNVVALNLIEARHYFDSLNIDVVINKSFIAPETGIQSS